MDNGHMGSSQHDGLWWPGVLIAAGISVAIIAVVQALGRNLNTTFTNVSNALK